MQPVQNKKGIGLFKRKETPKPEPTPAYSPAEQEYIRTLNDIKDNLQGINNSLSVLAEISIIEYNENHPVEDQEPMPEIEEGAGFQATVEEAVKKILEEQNKKDRKK